ncbi:MAG: ferritin-like domain-containing protein [Mycobacteriaceae bacterium]|nr:ferritin-like domain-containing protein [Mycobacteriaceae bacterium]
MTSPAPTSDSTADNDSLCQALAVEHATIYGYGIVAAHSAPDHNHLITAALTQHRQRRDQVIAILTARSVTPPVAAAGYQLPMPVNNAADAEHLAVRMEKDAATAWRAVIEQARVAADRAFGVTALTQSAVLAARWNQELHAWPLTTAFPGSNQ